MFLASWSRSRLKKRNTGAGAAPKKIGNRSRKNYAAPEPAPKTEDKMHKEILNLLLFFSQEPEPHVFVPLEPEPLKKIPGAGASKK